MPCALLRGHKQKFFARGRNETVPRQVWLYWGPLSAFIAESLEQAFKPLPDLDYEGVPVRPVGGFGAETGIVTVMSGQGVDSPAAFTEQTS